MKSLFFGLTILIFSLVVFLSAEIGITSEFTISILTFASFAGLLPFIFAKKNILLSPGRMFALSIIAFILARPIIFLFDNIQLIEVGNGINNENLSKTLSIIAISIWMSSICYSMSNFKPQSLLKSEVIMRINLSIFYSRIAFFAFMLFGLFFIFQSWNASISLQVVDYFAALNDPSFHSHIKYFFIAKFFGLIWLALTPSKNNFKICSAFMLLFSIGFLLIGLRGYFISYLFLFLYFYNEVHTIKLSFVILGSLLLLYGTSFILEYRLGFVVFENTFEMLSKPLYQQGATFEVIFGSISFPEEVANCISKFDYFSGKIPFGNCVDSARSVPFEEGGFASSFFAEAYYLGIFPLIIISSFIGIFVKYLDSLSKLRIGCTTYEFAFGAGLILFLVIPNLVYFARSSAFDFILKFITSLLLFLLLYKRKSVRNLIEVKI